MKISKDQSAVILFLARRNKICTSIFEKINSFIEYINKTCFAGIVTKEFHYAVYPQGSFYKKHIDTFQNDDRRTISVVCYLNQDWQDCFGGQLKLYLKDQTQEIFPTDGKIVLLIAKVSSMKFYQYLLRIKD